MAIQDDRSGDNVLELLRAAQASVQLVDRYLASVALCRYGYWFTLPQAPSSPGGAERSPKRRRQGEGEESGERVVEAVKLIHAAQASLQLAERYLDSIPVVCRHSLGTRTMPMGMRDNGEYLTECARCGKLL